MPHSVKEHSPTLLFFSRCVHQAALHSDLRPVWQCQRIIQSYPGSRCWSGSPPKSNHSRVGQV